VEVALYPNLARSCEDGVSLGGSCDHFNVRKLSKASDKPVTKLGRTWLVSKRSRVYFLYLPYRFGRLAGIGIGWR
jgi:hypothetical protein